MLKCVYSVRRLPTPEGQESNRILSEDEARFVDCANSAIFFSTEHTIFEF